MISGIYKITNKKTNEVYIGQAQDIGYRWKQHLSIIDNNQLHILLQEDPTLFCFEILELCPNDSEILDKRESFWIAKYNSIQNGYNKTTGGTKTFKLDSTLSLARKPVNQYSLDGTFIQSFSSVTQAKEITGIGHIDQCCRGERKTAGGFQWTYIQDCNDVEIIAQEIKNQPRKVVQYDMQGNYIQTFSSISEASQITKINSTGIIKVCQNNGYSAGGFRWTYEGENLISTVPKTGSKKQVMQKDIQTNEVINIFESASSAARALGRTSSSSISDACKGRLKTAYGYKWEFVNNE